MYFGVTHTGENDVVLRVDIHTGQADENSLTTVGNEPTTFGMADLTA